MCMAAGDACPSSLCRPSAGCSASPCPEGLSCNQDVCVRAGVYVCDGSVEIEELPDGSDWLHGSLPAALEGACPLSFASGPFCDVQRGSIYGVVSADVQKAWCVNTQVSFTSSGGGALGGQEADSLGIGPGVYTLDSGSADGSRATVIGAGPGATAVAGNVSLNGALSRWVGLTIDGDLHVSPTANGVALIDVVITGDLTVEGNNSAILGGEVHGDARILGNNASLVGVGFATGPELVEEPGLCLDSRELADSGEGPSVCP
jgi:hypothetical protein